MPPWVRRIRWTDDNIDHIGRHGVTQYEVEEVCYRDGDEYSRRVERTLYKVIGRTDAGRYLTVFLSPREEGTFYVVTARPSDRSERRLARRR